MIEQVQATIIKLVLEWEDGVPKVKIKISHDGGVTYDTALVTPITGTWKRYIRSFCWRHLLTSKVQIDEFISQVENSV